MIDAGFAGDVARGWCSVGALVAIVLVRRPLATFLAGNALRRSHKAAMFVVVIGALLFWMAAGGFIPAVRRAGVFGLNEFSPTYEGGMAALWALAGLSVWFAAFLLVPRRWLIPPAAFVLVGAMYFAVAAASRF